MITVEEPVLLRRQRILWLVLVAAWVIFAILTMVIVNSPGGTTFDLWLAPHLFDAAAGSEVVAGAGRVLDVLGGNLFASLLVLVIFVVLLDKGRPVLAAFLVGSAVGGLLLSSLFKGLVDRSRPPTVGALLSESTLSYPSGHATSGVTVVVALGLVAMLVFNPRWRWWVAGPLFVLGLLIGVSRVVIGVHWPTDVLGGWALGTAWTATVAVIAIGIAGTSRRAEGLVIEEGSR